MAAPNSGGVVSGLFFDQDWFDDRLKATGQSRGALARAAGMSVDEVEMVFRDQRELAPPEVAAFAKVLSAEPAEIADRSGAGDYGPGFGATDLGDGPGMGHGIGRQTGGPRQDLLLAREAVSGLHERMDRIERLLELVIAKLDKK